MSEPDICWRVCREIYADLRGLGGVYMAQRWNHKGQAVVYAAEHPALAAYEVLATQNFIGPDDSIEKQVLLEIDLSAVTGSIETAPPFGREDKMESRDYGTAWLQENRTVLLRVASVRVPRSTNILINPTHPRAEELSFATHAFSFR